MKTTINVPDEIQSPQFLKFISAFTYRFKKQEGFGRWLKEYQDMDEQGLFEPERLKELYLQILIEPTCLDFIRRQAVRYICEQALDATKAYTPVVVQRIFEPEKDNFCILRIPEGTVATDEDGDLLEGLSETEATVICDTLNAQCGEEKFKVFEDSLW